MIQIPAILDSYRSLKDRTLKVTFETSEPTPEQFMGIGSSVQQAGYLFFKSNPFTNREKDVIENMKADYEDTGKTPGQRLRGVLYVNFEQKPEGYTTFSDYYSAKMETIINHYKSKLD